jgi:drug/metabolite transporter (DMT)-like permease
VRGVHLFHDDQWIQAVGPGHVVHADLRRALFRRAAVGPRSAGKSPGFERPDPAALGILVAALLFAVATITARKIGEEEPLLAFSLFGSVISLQVYGVFTFWDGVANIPQGSQWGLFALIGVFHVAGSLMTSRAFSMTETALVAPFHYVQLLWGTLFGVVIFSTIPDVWTALGASLIVMSGLFLIYREHVRHRDITAGVTAHGGFDQD